MKRELFYPSPALFNDPFDCVVDIAEDLPVPLLRAFARSHFSLENPELHGPALDQSAELWTRDMKTPEGLRRIVAGAQERVFKSGVVCLSAKPDVPLMWAHYAESHTGIALQFARSDSNFLRFAKAVHYVDKYETAPLDGSIVALAQRALFTKASFWAYEEEWRVFNLRFCNACRPLEPGALTGIVLGLRTEPKVEQEIRKVLRDAPDSIRLFRAERLSGHYSLIVRDVV